LTAFGFELIFYTWQQTVKKYVVPPVLRKKYDKQKNVFRMRMQRTVNVLYGQKDGGKKTEL
jgi:hypothetical protein